ncbi:MAG: C_GCAxxG_C_C family protein [Lachnospiraceae bacterium]|nr:C_GCAxxG_C_C family protein [Lachnospiraceae bacterium]
MGETGFESRAQRAVKTFKEGYNCAQAVFATYADCFGMDRETAFKMSSAMGAGVGRMREVCGAVSSMAMLAGLKEGNTDPQDEEAKAHIYTLVRQMSARFKEEYGTIICRELLGIDGAEESAKPSIRTPEFYETRPCAKIIACAAQIIEDELLCKP